MKSITTVLFISLFAINFASIAKENPFKGTWQLISGEYLNDKKELINYDSLGISSQKVINEQHFSFVSMSNGKFWSAGTGTYTFTDVEYLESPKMASYPLEDGGTYTFKYEFKNDEWHNSRWHGDIRVEYEIWKKIK